MFANVGPSRSTMRLGWLGPCEPRAHAMATAFLVALVLVVHPAVATTPRQAEVASRQGELQKLLEQLQRSDGEMPNCGRSCWSKEKVAAALWTLAASNTDVIEPIVGLLKSGSKIAKENAAGALVSLARQTQST